VFGFAAVSNLVTGPGEAALTLVLWLIPPRKSACSNPFLLTTNYWILLPISAVLNSWNHCYRPLKTMMLKAAEMVLFYCGLAL